MMISSFKRAYDIVTFMVIFFLIVIFVLNQFTEGTSACICEFCQSQGFEAKFIFRICSLQLLALPLWLLLTL